MTSVPSTSEESTCRFCGKKRVQVDSLVSGRDGETIYTECLDLCNEILEEDLTDPDSRST